MLELVLGTAVLLSPAAVPPVDTTAQPALVLPANLLESTPQRSWRPARPHTPHVRAAQQSSTAAKVAGVAIGAVGGFFVGGMIGFAATQEDRDDDGVSGLRGVVIGAPVGAAIGALLGFQIAK